MSDPYLALISQQGENTILQSVLSKDDMFKNMAVALFECKASIPLRFDVCKKLFAEMTIKAKRLHVKNPTFSYQILSERSFRGVPIQVI